MKVAELLDILKITKQSLGRVLKQLLDEGYVGAERRRPRIVDTGCYTLPRRVKALALRLGGVAGPPASAVR